MLYLDTYALYEIMRGNPNYEKYAQEEFALTIFNLAELAYILKRLANEKDTPSSLKKYFPNLAEVTSEDLANAADLKHSSKHLSMVDAIGYAVAKRLEIRFLTGDSDFAKMPNVEYVKK